MSMEKKLVSRVLLVLSFLGTLSSGTAIAQAVCGACAAIPDDGQPINDVCTMVTVTWERASAGDCTLNPAPKCLPRAVCLFSLTVTVVDHGCGALYWAKFCTRAVDSNGNPFGGEICGDPSPFSNPTVASDYPVAGGKQDSLKFERVLNGVTQTIAHPKATCSACPAQAQSDEN